MDADGYGEFSHAKKGLMEDNFGSVVKIFTTSAKPNFAQPWAVKPQQKSTASGFILSDRRIFTNAHAIAFASSVQVRRYGNAKKFTARVGSTACRPMIARRARYQTHRGYWFTRITRNLPNANTRADCRRVSRRRHRHSNRRPDDDGQQGGVRRFLGQLAGSAAGVAAQAARRVHRHRFSHRRRQHFCYGWRR